MVAWGGSQDTRAAGCCTGASRDRSSGVIAWGGTASRNNRFVEHIGDKLSSGGFQGYF